MEGWSPVTSRSVRYQHLRLDSTPVLPLLVVPTPHLPSSLFRVCSYSYNILYIDSFSIVPAPTLFITVSTTDKTAGTTLSLMCDYTLSSSENTTVETEVVWKLNGSVVATSADGHISTAGVSLIFSPLTTSDTGTYTCTLTITTPQTPHVTVQGPVESEEEVITVQSKVHSIPHVIDMISLSLSPSA